MSTNEIRWEYDNVVIGHKNEPRVVEVSAKLIEEYALSVRNTNPAYTEDSKTGKLAMPSMLMRVAPLRRQEIASNNGFTALERATQNPRQTPFAKCEMRWFGNLNSGDTITSYTEVFAKEIRRGNKFVTFRVHANNQHGSKVGEYDYTCIFEYGETNKVGE